jgi:hypothetical protein
MVSTNDPIRPDSAHFARRGDPVNFEMINPTRQPDSPRAIANPILQTKQIQPTTICVFVVNGSINASKFPRIAPVIAR